MKKNYNAKELLQGYKVEGEHTSDPTTRLKIATDHLNESGDYYKKLDIMENTPLSKLQTLRKAMLKKTEPTSNAITELNLQDVPSNEHAFLQRAQLQSGDKKYEVEFSRPHGTREAIWSVKQFTEGQPNHTGFEWGIGTRIKEKNKQAILRAVNKLHTRK